MKRIFIALTLDDFIKDELGKLQKMLRPLIKKGRFVPPSLFHMTLQFLGELEEGDVLRLKELQFLWMKEFDPFSLSISHLGYFQKRNRWILWAGIEKNSSLDQLATKLHDSMAKEGFINHHPFSPHITLAREVQFNSDESRVVYETTAVTVPTSAVDGFHLMESTRVEGRLHYDSLKKFHFSD